MIKDLINRLRHLHYLDPLMNEAADALERLTGGDVAIPKPDTHCFDEDTGNDVWSYSEAQLRDYGDRRAAAERERCAGICDRAGEPELGAKYQGDVFAYAIRAGGVV